MAGPIEVPVKIKLLDQQEITNAFKSLATAAAGIFAIDKLEKFTERGIEEFSALQKSSGQLTAALGKQSSALESLASTSSRSSVYRTREIEEGYRRLAMYGLTEAQIKKMSPTMLNLAAVTGSTETAARLLGQAIENGTGRLQMYGFNMNKVKNSHDRFNEVMRQGEAFLKGQSDAAYAAMSPLEKMGRTIDDISMSFSKAFIPTLEKVSEWLTENQDKISDFMNALSEGLNWLVTSKTGIITAIAAIGTALTLAFISDPVGAALIAISAGIAAVSYEMGKWKVIQTKTAQEQADYFKDLTAEQTKAQIDNIEKQKKALVAKNEELQKAAASNLRPADYNGALSAKQIRENEGNINWYNAVIEKGKELLEQRKKIVAGPPIKNIGLGDGEDKESKSAKDKLELITKLAHDAAQVGMTEEQKELADLEDNLVQEQAIIGSNVEAQLNAVSVYLDKKKAIEAKYHKDKEKVDKDDGRKMQEAQEIYDAAAETRQSNKVKKEIAALQKEYDRKKKLLIDAGMDTINLDKEFSAERLQIQEQAAEASLNTTTGNLKQIAEKNRSFTGAYKVTASAMALIDTYKSAESVYAGFATIPIIGPGLGMAAAALAIATGLENVAKIDSAKMAAGGVVSVGEPGRDSVPAMLMPGEIVYNPTRPDPNLANMISSTTAGNTSHLHMGDIHIHGNADSRTVAAFGKAQEQAVLNALKRWQQAGKFTAPGLKIR